MNTEAMHSNYILLFCAVTPKDSQSHLISCPHDHACAQTHTSTRTHTTTHTHTYTHLQCCCSCQIPIHRKKKLSAHKPDHFQGINNKCQQNYSIFLFYATQSSKDNYLSYINMLHNKLRTKYRQEWKLLYNLLGAWQTTSLNEEETGTRTNA